VSGLAFSVLAFDYRYFLLSWNFDFTLEHRQVLSYLSSMLFTTQNHFQNNMAVSKKTSSTSSTSSSAKTRPNGTAAAANISKSAKENTTTTVTQAAMRSSAMKKTTAGNGLKPAAKPLQARTPSSQGVKDTEIAALLAKVAAQEGLSKYFLLALC
jgi:hypothetical protein